MASDTPDAGTVVAGWRVLAVGAIVALVLAPATATGTLASGTLGADSTLATSSTPASDGPSVVAAYPNPLVDGDVGEYVRLAFPRPTAVGNWTLTDGETIVSLPNETVDGTVLVAADAAAARSHYANATGRRESDPGNETSIGVDPPTVVHAPGLALANSGETLELTDSEGDVRSTLSYTNAPPGERFVDGAFRPIGATDYAPRTTRSVETRAFVTPDSAVPLDPIRSADDHVYVAGYTFASERVARALERASERGVDVRVLVDDAPVGGVTRRQVRVLDDLADSGVAVRAIGGNRARYDYHHAKYLVTEDEAVALTENWKPSGTGGHANRGWGVALADDAVARDLAAVFEGDWHAPDARSWSTVAADVAVDPATPANATYPGRIAPATLTAHSVTVLVAPDNAERALVAELRNATERVHVLQMTADRDSVLVTEAIAAARRGVDVRILLSAAWYAREENARTVDALNALADRADLPLEARLVDPAGRFEKVHAKGVVVDDAVVLGSINWNDHSLRENREIAVVLRGTAVADYYTTVFAADWKGGASPRVPRWLAIAGALAALALLALLARRLEFATQRSR